MNKLQMYNPLECGVTDVLPTLKYATDVMKAIGIGELMSKPEKMPEWSFNIPAKTCKVGRHLVWQKNSNCYDCYALEGHYRNSIVQQALFRRLGFAVHNPNFIRAMSFLINLRCDGKVGAKEKRWYKEHGMKVRDYWTVKRFRWFDSGDIQSEKMLDDICQICRNTPNVLHWLPTKEHKIVKRYIEAGNKIPDNLDLRLSSLFKSNTSVRRVTKLAIRLGLNTATVLPPNEWEKADHSITSFKCMSSKQGNKCLKCKACWTHKVLNVVYKEH